MPSYDLEEIRKKHPKRELCEIAVGGETFVGLVPGKADVNRYARDVALRGADRAIDNLIAGVFPGDLKPPLAACLEGGPFAALAINGAVLEMIGADAFYDDLGERAALDAESGIEVSWRPVTRADVNALLRRMNSSPMQAMREFLRAVVTSPEGKALADYLDEKPGRPLALYDAVARRSGMDVAATAKKLSTSATAKRSK